VQVRISAAAKAGIQRIFLIIAKDSSKRLTIMHIPLPVVTMCLSRIDTVSLSNVIGTNLKWG
jgi:hypothetical protein